MKPVGGRLRRHLPLLVVLALALLELGPLLLHRGFALTYDMVFVPRLPWSGSLLGLDGQPTRSVPSDAVVSVVSNVLPGDIVQKLVLLAVLVAAGVGAAHLAGGSLPRRLGAATVFVWNPFVYERLVIGHWTLLVGYAALPWAVAGAAPANPVSAGRRTGLDWRLLGPALVATAVGGPYAALLVLPAAVLVALLRNGPWPQRLCGSATVAAVGLVTAMPWWLPAVLGPGSSDVDPRSIDAFAPRADTALGSLGSLLGLGGVWNAHVSPPGRSSLLVAVVTLAFLALSVVGLTSHWSVLPGWRRGLAASAAAGLVLTVATTLPAGRAALRWVVAEVPAAGLLRDSQKLVAPWALLCAVGFGCGLSWLRARTSAHASSGARVLPLLLAALPIVIVPSLAWGAGGRLDPVSYPSGWETSASRLDGLRDAGAVLVLPWAAYRSYGWNRGRTVLDPAPRYFGGPAYSSLELPVGGVVLQDDGGPARAVADAADDAARVRAASRLGATAVLTESADGTLVAVDPVEPTGMLPTPVPVAPVVAGDLAALVLALTVMVASAGPSRLRLLL